MVQQEMGGILQALNLVLMLTVLLVLDQPSLVLECKWT